MACVLPQCCFPSLYASHTVYFLQNINHISLRIFLKYFFFPSYIVTIFANCCMYIVPYILLISFAQNIHAPPQRCSTELLTTLYSFLQNRSTPPTAKPPHHTLYRFSSTLYNCSHHCLSPYIILCTYRYISFKIAFTLYFVPVYFFSCYTLLPHYTLLYR